MRLSFPETQCSKEWIAFKQRITEIMENVCLQTSIHERLQSRSSWFRLREFMTDSRVIPHRCRCNPNKRLEENYYTGSAKYHTHIYLRYIIRDAHTKVIAIP